MLQLGSGLDSPGTLLEPCWRAGVADVRGAAESHGQAVDQRELVEPYWLSTETKSRKLAKTACANIGYEEM